MAVGLEIPDTIHPVDGVRLSCVSANIKKASTPDLVLFELVNGTVTAGVFTKNAFCAAPVTIAKEHLLASFPRALLINSGNANAGTGTQGMENCERSCSVIASQLGIKKSQVLPFSTGVISQQLPMDNLLLGIKAIGEGLSADNWLQAATGIMTTDTLPKIVSRKFDIGNETITITGICKGSGMIKPDMATMLAFVATDAKLGKVQLQSCLEEAVQTSFNSITVDGDTSTNDACILVATGQAQSDEISAASPEMKVFKKALTEVCIELAQSIVRDGEGATKFITLNVTGGRDVEESREVAYTVAHSPLVKTAFFASDPNIGRLLAAVGRSRIDSLKLETVYIALDEVDLVLAGEPAASYSEERGQMVMDRKEISVNISLGRGDAEATIWTTDLSNEYVRINAEYRT